MSSPFLTAQQLAARWHLTPKTLSNWRNVRKGPNFIKVGKSVLYHLNEVETYEKEKLIKISNA